MRSHLWLLAAAGHLAGADWSFGQPLDVHGAPPKLPRETRASTHDGANGWTPRPTEGPANPMELVRKSEEWMRKKRQTESGNTWTDEHTCGWIAGLSSRAFTCTKSETCATNTDRVVACTSSGMEEDPFFTVCLNYEAVKAGLCNSAGPKTGCCMTSTQGACITYVWPGTTQKSMYRCYTTSQDIITMLNEPQFVIDQRTRTTSTTSASTSSDISSTTTNPLETTSSVSQPAGDKGGSNTGAIVGGVVGGVAGVAVIAGGIAFLIIRSRNKDNNVGAGTAYSAVAPAETSYPPGGPQSPPTGYPPSSVSPQMSQAGYYPPPSTMDTSSIAPGTPYLASTTPPVPGAYDPRQSYYDPANAAKHQQMAGGHLSPPVGGYPGAPPQQGMYAAGAVAPQGAFPAPAAVHISELDTATVPSGHAGNPVEMADSSPAQR
ncbi:hypothetical protein VTI74DRAFT_9213 [Chaetomium olivicolor]